jgi:hypothetical protein
MKDGKLCNSIKVSGGVLRIKFSDGGLSERIDCGTELGTYKGGARWEMKNDRLRYMVTIREGYQTVEKLGQVWPKKDGRWNWVRSVSKFQAGWGGRAQGVTATEQEAIDKVLEGWND